MTAFSGVPKGTTGDAVRDDMGNKIEYKVTWNLTHDSMGLPRTRPLVDWFDESEFKQYLVKI